MIELEQFEFRQVEHWYWACNSVVAGPQPLKGREATFADIFQTGNFVV